MGIFPQLKQQILLISNCSGENLSCPFKGFCFSYLCWHLKDCGGRKLSGMSKKKKKSLELLNWVFPNVSAKGRQLFFFNVRNVWRKMCNILNNLTYIKFSWNLNYTSFPLLFCVRICIYKLWKLFVCLFYNYWNNYIMLQNFLLGIFL